jgi:dTDP-4-amino-4,6-dideoxygalactose transaminase
MLRIKGISEEKRDTIIAKISEKEVAVNVHYLPLPMLSFYKKKGYAIEDFPQTYANFKTEITLPVYYNLTDQQVDTVIETVIKAVEEVI